MASRFQGRTLAGLWPCISSGRSSLNKQTLPRHWLPNDWLHWVYIGNMENKLETTNYLGFRV